MEKRKFTLRKGIVVETISSSLYRTEDTFTKKEILVSLSGKEVMNGVTFNLGEFIYIVTSPYDLKRGRHYSKNQFRGLNIDFKSLMTKLDNGIDPLDSDITNEKQSKKILKKVSVKSIKDNVTYLVEDIFNSEELTMKISGKMRMNYIKISIDDIVFMVLPDKSSTEGKLIFEKYICLHNEDSDLCQQKRQIEELEKNRK